MVCMYSMCVSEYQSARLPSRWAVQGRLQSNARSMLQRGASHRIGRTSLAGQESVAMQTKRALTNPLVAPAKGAVNGAGVLTGHQGYTPAAPAFKQRSKAGTAPLPLTPLPSPPLHSTPLHSTPQLPHLPSLYAYVCVYIHTHIHMHIDIDTYMCVRTHIHA